MNNLPSIQPSHKLHPGYITKHLALLTRGQEGHMNRPEHTKHQIRKHHRANILLNLGLGLSLDRAQVFGASVRTVIMNKDEECGLARAVWGTQNFPWS